LQTVIPLSGRLALEIYGEHKLAIHRAMKAKASGYFFPTVELGGTYWGSLELGLLFNRAARRTLGIFVFTEGYRLLRSDYETSYRVDLDGRRIGDGTFYEPESATAQFGLRIKIMVSRNRRSAAFDPADGNPGEIHEVESIDTGEIHQPQMERWEQELQQEEGDLYIPLKE